jgi:uncharacterized protein YutE (UPF0331/DUF86 family)
MTSALIRAAIVLEKAAWINSMISAIRKLLLADLQEFIADSRTPAAAESYLRRALESLPDMGRLLPAKGFAITAGEYKQITEMLVQQRILSSIEVLIGSIRLAYFCNCRHFRYGSRYPAASRAPV